MTENPWLASRTVKGDEYEAHYEERAAAGENVHGEADFVEWLEPTSILDAGCGTGRVGRELAQRGYAVVGVDLDEEMLATARRKDPDTPWFLGDLATIQLDQRFDCVVMAGNIMLFVTPGTEAAVIKNLAHHLIPGGLLISGMSLKMRPEAISLAEYDRLAIEAGLVLQHRFVTWDRQPYWAQTDYAVSVHQLARPGAPVKAAKPARTTHQPRRT